MQTLSKNKLKWLRSLRLNKNRNSERKFLLFGEKIIHDLQLSNPDLIDLLFSSNDAFCVQNECFYLDDKELKSISGFKSSPGYGAVVNFPEFDLASRTGDITLYLDGIQDPGNLGTIIRTADWFNIKEIVCSIDTVDVYNPKVSQASMGSIFHVPVRYSELGLEIESCTYPVYGATLDGKDVFSLDINGKLGVVIGSEGQGIREQVLALLDDRITIPNQGKAESLNAAIATGILLAVLSLK